MSHQHKSRRLLAGGGTLALALSALFGAQTAASAEGYPQVPDQAGTLTLHKHVAHEDSTPLNPAGAPLGDVGFSVQQIGVMDGSNCVAVDLTVPAGWEQVSDAIDALTTSGIPAGFCATTEVHNVLTLADGSVAIPNLRGLFLVTETSPGPHMISSPAVPFLVTVPLPVEGNPGSWNFDVHAYPKNTLTTSNPTKTVGDENVEGEVVPGALVPWNVSAPIPTAAFPYTVVTVTDNPATGHSFVEWGDVSLNGTLLADPDSATPDYSVSGNIITLTAAGLAKVNAIVTGVGAVSATLSLDLITQVDADVAPGALQNKASLTLNGQTFETPGPQTNWGKVTITKHVAGDATATLAGARFAIFEQTAAGCEVDVTGTAVWQTPATPDPSAAVQSAVLWISNTEPGESIGDKTYCLLETQAPTGYVLDPLPREITVSSANDWESTYAFPNVPVEGPQLPLTGGTGTLAFGIAGLTLIAAAGTLFAVRRREQRTH